MEVSKDLIISKEVPEKIEFLISTETNPKVVATCLMTLRDIASY